MPKLKLIPLVRQTIRTRNYSPSTEKAYVYWTKRFVFFNNLKHPKDMGAEDVKEAAIRAMPQPEAEVAPGGPGAGEPVDPDRLREACDRIRTAADLGDIDAVREGVNVLPAGSAPRARL